MKRSQFAVTAVVLVVGFGGGIATAATKAPVSVKACVDKKGDLSLISKGKCARGTTLLKLGVQGAVGPAGPAGAAGSAGQPGSPGTPGAPGVPGTPGAAGPSAVYWLHGTNNGVGPSLSPITVPAGDYVVTMNNDDFSTSAAAGPFVCNIDFNGAGDGLASSYANVPANGNAAAFASEFVHAASAFTVGATCPVVSGLGSYTTVTVTATASLTPRIMLP